MAQTSPIETYLDLAIASAKRETGSPFVPQGSVSTTQGRSGLIRTILDSLVARLWRYPTPVVLATFPLLALGLATLINAIADFSFGPWPHGALPLVTALAILIILGFLVRHSLFLSRRVQGKPLLRRRSKSNSSVQTDTFARPIDGGELIHWVFNDSVLLIALGLIAIPSLPLFWRLSIAIFVLLLDLFINLLFAIINGLDATQAVRPATGIAVLDGDIERLRQIREWLQDDRLRALVDNAIGQQTRASERRQATWSTMIALVSLLAGWGLSAVSPAVVGKIFSH